MYSGRIAVPPGGGGIQDFDHYFIYYLFCILEDFTLIFLQRHISCFLTENET
jgi:hypothetical protein